MFTSPDSRKAAFANMRRKQLRYFPVQGKRTRARRNRALLGTVGLLSTGAGLAVVTHGGRRMGPFSPFFGPTGQGPGLYRTVNINGQDITTGDLRKQGTYHFGGRPATASEAFVARMLNRLAPGAARKMGIRREFAGRPIYRRYIAEPNETVAQSLKRNRYMWVRKGPNRFVWMVPTVSVDAQAAPAFRRALGRRIERASLWNIFGKGKLYDVIEQASLHGQEGARGITKTALTAVAKRIERPLGRAVARGVYRPVLKADRFLKGFVKRGGIWLLEHGTQRLA